MGADMQQLWTRSTFVFALLALTLVGIKLLFDFYPGGFPHESQAQAFTWPLVGGMIAFAAVGLGALCIVFWFLHVIVFRGRLRSPLWSLPPSRSSKCGR